MPSNLCVPQAQAASINPEKIHWPNLPLACLPQRATYWDSDSNYTPCHCPPAKTFCPKTNDEWRDLMNRPAPPELVLHCCWNAYVAAKSGR